MTTGGAEAKDQHGRCERQDGSPHQSPDTLAPLEAAVLIYLQADCTTVSRIALALGVWSEGVREALRALAAKGYASHISGSKWQPAGRGVSCWVAQPDPADLPIIGRRNKRRDPTTSASRALQHLSQPRYGKELAKLLGVSVQQVRNVVERLHAEGSIRVADPDEPAFVIARAADPNVLLTRAEARVLSSFPDAGYVSSGRVRVVCKYAAPDVDLILARLRQYGLTTSTRRRWRNRPTMLYQLTDRGRQHWQRSRDLRKAHPIPPYPSKRVFMVLKFLAENQPTKAKQVSDSLAIPYQSTNALLQYFKRQNLAYRADRKTPHGYMITEHGNDVLADLEIYWQSVSKG